MKRMAQSKACPHSSPAMATMRSTQRRPTQRGRSEKTGYFTPRSVATHKHANARHICLVIQCLTSPHSPGQISRVVTPQRTPWKFCDGRPTVCRSVGQSGAVVTTRSLTAGRSASRHAIVTSKSSLQTQTVCLVAAAHSARRTREPVMVSCGSCLSYVRWPHFVSNR